MVDQGLQELREEMAWMRSRLSAPSQGSKGKGKGKAQAKPKPKGASQGAPPSAPATQASSEGPARRRPNLKPNEERATPTLIEIKCQKCQAYNCMDQPRGLQILRDTLSQATGCLQQFQSTIAACGQATRHGGRQVLRGCRRRLRFCESVCADLGQGRALQTPGGIGDHHWDLAGRVTPQDVAFHSTGLRQRQIERPQAAGSQARLGNRRGQEGHRQAGKGRGNLETGTGGIGASPTPGDPGYPRTGGRQGCGRPASTSRSPPPGSVSLSSDDVAGLISFFQELAEEREAAPGAEPPSKKGRVGPYGETPSLKAAKDAAVRAKLERGQAYLGFMLNQSLKSGNGSCQAATQETPSQKGSGKGSSSVPGKGAAEPPSPCSHYGKGKGEGSNSANPTGSRQQHGRCTSPIGTPLLRGCGGLLWLCSFVCLLAQMWLEAPSSRPVRQCRPSVVLGRPIRQR